MNKNSEESKYIKNCLKGCFLSSIVLTITYFIIVQPFIILLAIPYIIIRNILKNIFLVFITILLLYGISLLEMNVKIFQSIKKVLCYISIIIVIIYYLIPFETEGNEDIYIMIISMYLLFISLFNIRLISKFDNNIVKTGIIKKINEKEEITNPIEENNLQTEKEITISKEETRNLILEEQKYKDKKKRR